MKSIAKAQNDFTIFKFGDSEIRVINKCGEPCEPPRESWRLNFLRKR
ncbi:phage antirepressor protein [Escherichia coli O145:H28]|nr:phage antirepressor protein [Escherichia coli O145:H28]GEG65198.1 phage antirepressor protein [Escherichia coli O145:H28]GEH87423.1 phage antirepressor protein [Escherichia coli O145:H28]